jgi:hypothetical protein
VTIRTDRGAALLRTLLVVVVVLLAALFAADRAGAAIAERIAGTTIENSQHLNSRPGVDIAGFPFLTQLTSRNFDKVTIVARGVPVDRNADRLDLTRVQVVLNRVRVARDFSSVEADSATATASVDYAELSKRLQLDVSYAGGGRVKAAKTLTVLGRTLSPSISAAPHLTGTTISFGSVRVDGLGALSGQLTPSLTGAFGLTVPLSRIPFDVQVRSVAANADGLSLVLTGSNLTYSRS